MNLYAYIGNNSVMFVDPFWKEKNLINYMLWDEYIKILREDWSIAWIDAIFIEVKRLAKWDIDKTTDLFVSILKWTTNSDLEARQPLSLYKIWLEEIKFGILRLLSIYYIINELIILSLILFEFHGNLKIS